MLVGALVVIAMLYSAVGHGGASGYIAVLTLAGFSGYEIRSQVLFLNVVVSMVSFVQFCRTKNFQFRLTWPFILAGVPFAYWGATLHLTGSLLSKFLGIILVFASIRLFWVPNIHEKEDYPSLLVSLVVGSVLVVLLS